MCVRPGYAALALIVLVLLVLPTAAVPVASAGPTGGSCLTITTGRDAPPGLPRVAPWFTGNEIGLAFSANAVVTGAFASAVVDPALCARPPPSGGATALRPAWMLSGIP